MRILLLLILLTGAVQAQEPLPWYTVEVLVFARLEPQARDEEVWPLDPGRPDLTGAIEVGARSPQGWRFPRAGAALAREWASLRRSKGYRPLLRRAWRQPGLGRGQALPVHLSTGTRDADGELGLVAPPPEVDGTVRVYRARYLHVQADLVYFSPPPGPAGGRVDTAAGGEPPAVSEASLFRLTESRRMRSGQLHYLDHPMFGMLVRVTPYEVQSPTPVAGTPPDGDPPGASGAPP